MMNALPRVKVLLADHGHDARWVRKALIAKGIPLAFLKKKNRKIRIPHGAGLYKKRHIIKNMVA